MKNTIDINKIKGALYGFAIGDAMGATTEFADEYDISRCYGKVDHIIGGGWLKLEPGQVTDDTEMTLCVAQAYIDSEGGTDQFLTYCTQNFVDWLDSEPRDVGNTCRTAIMENRDTNNPYKWMDRNYERQILSGHMDFGNGALMRCLFPILCGNIGAALMQAKLTHNNTLNDRMITFYSMKVKAALNGTPFSKYYNGYVSDPTGHIADTLENVMYWVSSTDNFRDSILGPVNRGGDADTIAAITGGLTGAYYGYDAIPAEWISELDPKIRKKLDHYANWAWAIQLQAK